ncbi:MAG: polynucleotide kinase-phosphatase, partial [Stackebrandtia sp.]
FFNSADLESQLLRRVRDAADATGLWTTLDSDWFVLDCELMPWSAKAKQLIRDQYAAVGAAARVSLSAADTALRAAAGRGLDVAELLSRNETRARNASAFREAYARYCWDVDGLEGVRLAPFQILAAEGHNLARRSHDWHLEAIAALCAADPTDVLQPTRHVLVDLADEASRAEAVGWWTALTTAGGEGMVVKPVTSVLRGDGGLAQPGVKVRGREYLRIIYGPDYTEPANLDRLRGRFLGRKRSLALREYALGMEALDRLAANEAPWRIHEAVFGVLALESEPVDPRL